MNKVLVLSMNSMSSTKNNGKTLYSLFKERKDCEIAQLYFTNEYPDVSNKYSYFRITDKDMMLNFFGKGNSGKRISPIQSELKRGNNLRGVPKNILTIFVREIIWKNRWKSRQLDQWLEEIRPNVIFFMAGDVLFAYDICDYIQKKFQCKVIVYITDDYVDIQNRFSVIKNIRKYVIKKKMKQCIKKSEILITISEMMRRRYKEIFHKDSIIYINSSVIPCMQFPSPKGVEIVYAGSLYYGRYKNVLELARTIKKINERKIVPFHIKFSVYSQSALSEKRVKALNSNGEKVYKGSVNEKQLEIILNKADILLHTESFEKCNIEKVKYSFSTKIPEYLSLGKFILALGPQNVASINFLNDMAYCINRFEDIEKGVVDIIENYETYKKKYEDKSKKKYLDFSSMLSNNKALINKEMDHGK